MQLVPWCDLPSLRLPPHAGWLVVGLPTDPETWRRGVWVSARLNRGRLSGDQFALATRTSCNATLSRRLPGRRILKALFQAMDIAGMPRSYALPHVSMLHAVIETHFGPCTTERLVAVFEVLLWVWGPPDLP